MVAPGKHLDFGESAPYAKRVAQLPGLANAIMEQLQSWPDAGTRLCDTLHEQIIELGQREYVVLYLRKKQVVGLLNIFESAVEGAALEAYRQRARAIFCSDEKGGRS